MRRKTIKLYLIITFFVPFITLTMGFSNQPNSQLIIHRGNLYYFSHTIVVKLKGQPSTGLSKTQDVASILNNSFSKFKFTTTKTLFGTDNSTKASELNKIIVVKFEGDYDPVYVAKKIKESNSSFEWVEPKYVRRLAVVPNDPNLSSQYNLMLIQAEQAWNISTGDTSVVIGIIDSGVDWPHPDLYPNIWHNWKQIKSNWSNPIENIVGDSIGWDFGGAGDASGNATPDNNPIEDIPTHGTFVAGIASAVTNNGIGVAGIGYKCKLMPVKVAQENQIDLSTGEPYILYGFEGIKYAVDNGAKVINCSWGGGGYSNSEQAVIDYAVSNGALVVAAAGNESSKEKFYPSCYKGVLSVGATDVNDKVAHYSNYGTNIAVMAPGTSIYSTWQPDIYQYGSGTSFSSPLVAGLAALVTSYFPAYTPLQVAEQIRVNCDNIDSLNSFYAYKIGRGRINAYKALTNTNSESVRAVDIQFSDAAPGGNGNGILEPGETITVGIKFVNYLRAISNLNITLVSAGSYITVNNASFSKSNIAALGSMDNYDSKFTFTLAGSLPYDTTLQLRLVYTDGDYSDFQLIDVPVNPTYLKLSGSNVALTITSKGNFGYNDYPTNLQGEGFKYKGGNNFLFEGALMYGTSSSTINDAARDNTGNLEDQSFSIQQPLKINTSNDLSYNRGIAVFNDGNSSAKLNITTLLDSYTFASAPDNNYVLLKYSFINKSQSAISNFYAGIFFDWDMVDGSGDSAAYDTQGNLGYIKHAAGTFDTLIATALISSNDYGYWAILNDGSDGNFGIFDGFSVSEKWKALSSGLGKLKAGTGDISEVTSGGPYSIPAGDTLNVAFAMAAGNTVDDLRSAIASARSKYQQILTNVDNTASSVPYSYNLMQNYPNPFNPSTKITYQIAKEGNVFLRIYDILGREVVTLVNGHKPAGNYSISFNASYLPSGIYFYRLSSGSFSSIKKMVLLK